MTAPEPRGRNVEVVNPLRDEQRRHIRDELEASLRHRYVPLFGAETDEEVLSMANAVERFEAAVMAAGDRYYVVEGNSETLGGLPIITKNSSSHTQPYRPTTRRVVGWCRT